MRINVTAQDIETGIKHHCTACPIARAGSRAFKEEVVVGHFTMHVNMESYGLPPKAQSFINRFDQGLPVEPFSFKV